MVVEKTRGANHFILLYGTATGQAKAICEEIAEKAPSFGLSSDIFELDDIGKKFNLEKEHCVVIVTSTTGDGDPPPNAEKFMRRIKKRVLASDYLAHCHYALLGLGDSNYSNFNRCARDLDTRLEELGANKLYPPGFADDGVGLEVVADGWLEGLYPALQKHLGLNQACNPTLTESVAAKAPATTDSTNGTETSVKSLKISSNGDTSDNNKSLTDDSKPAAENGTATNGTSKTPQTSANTKSDLSSSSDSGMKLLSNGSDNISNTKTQSSGPTNTADEDSPPAPAPISEHSRTLRSENKLKALASQSGTQWPETPCVIAAKQTMDDASSPSKLVTLCPPLSEQSLTVPLLPPPYLDVDFKDEALNLTSLVYQNDCKLPSSASAPVNVSVTHASVLTAPDAVKKTLQVRLSLEGTDIEYSPGDALSIICPNNGSEVDLLIQRLQVEDLADQAINLRVLEGTKKRRAAVPPHIHPSGSSLRHLLRTCVSIREPPTKAFIRALVEYTKDEGEKRRLQELCSKEGAQAYTQCVRQGHVTLLDFLYAFPSCSPPVETILEHLPRLQPRPYSACSCQEVTPKSVDIVFNVVELEADVSRGHLYSSRGACTGWLDDITQTLQQGKQSEQVIQIPVFVRTNQHFRPPTELNKPLIMIGPGTGVAPFIGFLESRRLMRGQLQEGATYGETWLYFGCRNKEKDFLFREKLEDFEKDGTLTQLRVTFSRDNLEQQDAAKGQQPPRYVQDQMRLDSADLARLLGDEESLVYVCGDATNMAADVGAAFEDILQTENGLSKDDAHMLVMKKRIHKTYLEDVWG